MQGVELLRQGEEVAAILEARNADGTPLYPTVGVLEPRRATKTTSILAVILGRCDTRPGHRAVMTAQDGVRARGIFRGLMRTLEFTADFEGVKDSHKRRGRLRWSNGEERIEWDNGSVFWVIPPDASAFRSDAADTVLFEEAGEYSPEKSGELQAGALPLMDTRPMGQVIVTGTPSPTRTGLLWDTVQDGINPKLKTTGVLAYMAEDHEDSYTLDDNGERVLNEKLLRRVHPGIGTLTTLPRMRERFEKMPLAKFEMEYLCRFPFDISTSAIDPKAWTHCRALDDDGRPAALPVRPDRVGLGYDVEPDSSSASLVAAWRDDDGRACFEVLACRPGTAWLPETAKAAAKKHRCAVGYDSIGSNSDPAERLNRLRVRLDGLSMRSMQGATARIAQDIHHRRAQHWGQTDLDNAVDGAAWRSLGDGGRLFARKLSTQPVSTLVAAAVALWQYDRAGQRPNLTFHHAGDRT